MTKMRYRISIFIILLLLVFVSSTPVFSLDSGQIWLGKLAGPPSPENCNTGMIYYDTSLSILRKSTDSSCSKWEQLPGKSMYERFVIVGVSGKADFTVAVHGPDCIQNAINSLSNSSENKKSAVIILPGEYNLGKKTIKCLKHVDLIGTDSVKTLITGKGLAVVNAANNCGIMNLSVNNANESLKSTAITCKKISSFSYLSGCRISASGTAIKCTKSLSIIFTGCNINSRNKTGIAFKKSDSTIFDTHASGKPYALECLSSSKTALYNSSFTGIYISKNSTVEINNTDLLNATVTGEKGGVLLTDEKEPSFTVSPDIKINQPRPILERKTTYNRKRSPSAAANYLRKKDSAGEPCGCKKSKKPVKTIAANELRNLLKKSKNKLLVVDVRHENYYKIKHIKNAVNIPRYNIKPHLNVVPSTEKELVFYCDDLISPIAEESIRIFNSMGYNNTRYFPGGLKEWVEKGFSTRKSRTNKKKKKEKHNSR